MKKTKAISVVIPAYNEEKYIRPTLKALEKQTVMADEVIVVDNNSKDRTAKIAKEFKFVKVVRERQQGIAHSRNAGYNFATGDIIARIDADTLVAEDWIETIHEVMKNEKLIGISGSTRFYDVWPAPVYSELFHFFAYKVNKLVCGYPVLWGTNMAFRRSAWLSVKGSTNNDDIVWEDLDLTMRISKFGKIKYVRKLKVRSSARSAKTSAGGLLKYVSRWPRTLKQFSLASEIMAIFFVMVLTVFFLVPVLLTAWIPESTKKNPFKAIKKRIKQGLY